MYINQPYEQSAAYRCTMNATPEQLAVRRGYTVIAINYHKRNHNKPQVEFFEAELALIDKRLAGRSKTS